MGRRGIYKDIIKEIGIPEEMFLFYIQTFIKQPYPYMVWSGISESWTQLKYTLNKSTIARHLKGEITIATYGSFKTSYFVIDLDYNKAAGDSEIWERVNKIRRIFPSGILITSSPSKGFHYYVFFDSEYSTNQVQKLVRSRLTRHGISIKAGYVEIFPDRNKALRSPFGMGSDVIYIDNGNVATSKYEDIYIIENCADFVSFKEVFDADDYIFTSNQTNKISPLNNNLSTATTTKDMALITNNNEPSYSYSINSSITEHLSSSNLSSSNTLKHFNSFILGNVSNFTKECMYYLENGIQERGTRNELVYKLVWYLMKICHLPSDKTYEIMVKWLEEKNNGKSELWNKNPRMAIRKLEAQIRWAKRQGEARWDALSRDEVSGILELNLSFKESWFLFELKKCLKTHADENGYVYLSRNLFWRMNGCSHRNYQKRIAVAVKNGFIKKVRNYVCPINGKGGVTTKYQTKLTFDKDKQEYVDFPNTAAQILGKEEFIRRWGCYYWRKYVKGNDSK